MALCSDHKKLIQRINRISGQVAGLKKMVEDDRGCFEVLKQVAAVGGAVRGLGSVILESHLKGCVADALREKDSDATIQEIIDIFNKFSK